MKKYRLFWTRADKQSDLFMGEFDSEFDAREAIPAMIDSLILIGNAGDEKELREGTWSIE